MTKIKLSLFVIGNSPLSKCAIRNLNKICSAKELHGRCDIEVIDLIEHQGLAEVEKILATPILIRKSPLPERRIIGDLSNTKKILATLELPGSDDE